MYPRKVGVPAMAVGLYAATFRTSPPASVGSGWCSTFTPHKSGKRLVTVCPKLWNGGRKPRMVSLRVHVQLRHRHRACC